MEIPIKMDDLGVPLLFGNNHGTLVKASLKPVAEKFSRAEWRYFPWAGKKISRPRFIDLGSVKMGITLPSTNIAPENDLPQKESGIPTIHFQVRTVSFSGCRTKICGQGKAPFKNISNNWKRLGCLKYLSLRTLTPQKWLC